MITIEATSRTQENMKNMANGKFIKNKISSRFDLLDFAIAAKLAVQQHLEASLGKDKAKHFKVTFSGSNQYGINIRLEVDEIGALLMSGAQPHIETGGYMSFTGSKSYEGEQIVTQFVDHPGFKGIKEDVDKLVEEAISKVLIFWSSQ